MASHTRTRDMTQGHPLRLILSFGLPLLLGACFQQIYGVVDTMVAGHYLGDHAIAAIGATSALSMLLISLSSGLNSGYAIVVTRAFGSHRREELRQSIAGMMMLNLTSAVVLTALSLALLPSLLSWLNTPQSIRADAHTYIAWICAGLGATIAYNMFASILNALGNSRSPLGFLILSSLLNIALDLLFVIGLDMGVGGAALATVIAQLVSSISCGIYVFLRYRDFLPTRRDFHLSGNLFASLTSMGLSMALMICVVHIGSIIFQSSANTLGQTSIAAYAAARRILGVMIQPIATMATALSTFVGQNRGAGKMERIRTALRQCMLVEVGWSVFAFLFALLFAPGMIRLITGTSDAQVLGGAVQCVNIQLALLPALAVLQCLRTTMQACGHKVVPVVSSCIELGMKALAALWLIPVFGYTGVCATEPVTWLIMAVFLAVVWFRLPESKGA